MCFFLKGELLLVNEKQHPGSLKPKFAFRMFKVVREGNVIKLGSFAPMPVPDNLSCPSTPDEIEAFIGSVNQEVEDTVSMDIAMLQVCVFNVQCVCVFVCVCVCVCVFVLCDLGGMCAWTSL